MGSMQSVMMNVQSVLRRMCLLPCASTLVVSAALWLPPLCPGASFSLLICGFVRVLCFVRTTRPFLRDSERNQPEPVSSLPAISKQWNDGKTAGGDDDDDEEWD